MNKVIGMIMAGRDILHMMSRDRFQESVSAKYPLDNIAGYLITWYVTSWSGMGKIAWLKKSKKKKLKDSEKLAEYNKYIVSIMRKLTERENRTLKMRTIQEARLSLITAHMVRSGKKETVGYRCY